MLVVFGTDRLLLHTDIETVSIDLEDHEDPALPIGVLPLKAAAQAYARDGHVLAGTLIVTADEALWLPPGAEPTDCVRALRMFVSRLADQTRLAVYGSVIAGRDDLVIEGDRPDAGKVGVLMAKAEAADISSWLIDGAVQTGTLDRERLAVAQVTLWTSGTSTTAAASPTPEAGTPGPIWRPPTRSPNRRWRPDARAPILTRPWRGRSVLSKAWNAS